MTVEKLNRLATKVVEFLSAKYNDPPYTADKVATLRGQDTFQTLLWCHNLDPNNQRELARELGISDADFRTTLAVVKKIANS